MITLLIASRNMHKVAEIRAILGPAFQYLTLNDFPSAPSVIEDAPTFSGNAAKKAVSLAKWLSSNDEDRFESPEMVLADDSGLEVDALGGAPGVHSARFATLDSPNARNSPDAANNAKLLRLLEGVPAEKRTARFRCVLALTPLTEPEPENASPVCHSSEAELRTELFEGVCEGRIAFAPRGDGGFGYDPLFIPIDSDRSFAELSENAKNQFSHRAMAMARLRKHLTAL